MNRRVLIPIVAGSLLAGIAGFVTCRGTGPSSNLLVSGNIEVTQVEASFRLAGKVLERRIEEGQTVQEGQILALLDARDLEQTLAMRQADSKLAQAALSELQAGSRKEEIETAKAVLDQTVADFQRLAPDEARVRDLHTQGIVSTRDYESVRAALVAAKAKVRQAEQQYVLMQKGPRLEDLTQGQARLEQAQQAMGLAQTQLGYTTLTAPCPGVVLSVNVEAREYVAPGTAVATIGNLTNVWLRAYVEETDLGRVKVGQKAFLTTDTFPGRKYEGHVSFVASEAEFTPKSVQTKKERVKLVYRIKIDVPNPTLELKPGMPADAEIQVGQATP